MAVGGRGGVGGVRRAAGVGSVFGAFAVGGHFDEVRVKPAEDIDEVLLGGHDLVDVFVDAGNFVEAGGDEFDSVVFEEAVYLFPCEGLDGLGAAHDASGAVGGGLEGGGFAFAADEEAWGGHRTGDDAEDVLAGGGGAFAVDDEVAGSAVDEVAFPPGEVVVVFDVEEDLEAKVAGDVVVDEGVIGGGVASHEFHGGPVFLAVGLVEGEPGEVFVFFGEVGVVGHGAFAVVIADGGAGAAAAAVAEQGDVGSGGKVLDGLFIGEDAEFDEVIAAAAGAELGPGAVPVLSGDRAEGPIGLEDGVVAAALEGGADAEAGFGLDGADEMFAAAFEVAHGEVEHGEFHAARDIDADGIGDHGVVGGEDSPDGEAVADVGVGHEGAGDGDRELAGAAHLVDGFRLEALAPLLPGGGGFPEGPLAAQQGRGELPAESVAGEGGGVAHDGFDLGGELGLIESFEDVAGDQFHAAAGGFARGNAEADEVFGVHGGCERVAGEGGSGTWTGV